VAAVKLQPIAAVPVAPLTWHVDSEAKLQRLQQLQDKARGYPRPATDADGRPVAGATVVEHYAGVQREAGGARRYRLRALPPDAFTNSPVLTASEVAEIAEAAAGDLPLDWKDEPDE
jgi:hypothetical protein